MTRTPRPFNPDWASPPGGTIEDVLEERNWSKEYLAKQLGLSVEDFDKLIEGEIEIDQDLAFKLEKYLGSTAKFWLKREEHYREKLAELATRKTLFESWIDWLNELPVKEMMSQALIEKCIINSKNKHNIVKDLLYFFDVDSPDEWRTKYATMEGNFRRTRESQSDIGAIAAWIRQGEIIAEDLVCPEYSKPKFEQAVDEIRSLTVLDQAEFLHEMQKLCFEAGVVFILVPSIKGAHISGMARWLNSHTALIQLSLYGKKNDRFWFTFFHEAAHILLHGKDDIFLDEWDSKDALRSQKEDEADQKAKEILIPPEYDQDLPHLKSRDAVIEFAKSIGVHPGIVVGRLQYDEIIPHSWMNDLKISISIDQAA
jgi:HTH-type transcriptional regulator/antitoxin HigA